MSFANNSSQQISIFDATSNLTKKELKMLEKSWAKYFAENIFPAIDEEPFKILYSDRPSRHNTPVNVIIGALIIKEIFHLTDEEIVETLPFDIRYQYALHTTSFEEQPLNDRTLGRFRARCNTYEEHTGIDLIHQCVVNLSSEIAKMMKVNNGMRRMDSLMIASNIKKMSRLELLYTCVANLAKQMCKAEDAAFPESLVHYTQDEDHNRVLYHNRSEDTGSRIAQVLKDAAKIIAACGSRYDESSEYQLLIRVIDEQTDKDADGNLILKQQKSGMNSEILQNPADPDATFREKAGKENRGYIANIVEAAEKDNSVAVDYQFEKNIYSDSQFVKDYLEQQPVSEKEIVLVADGGYCGHGNAKQASAKNICLITTDMKGADVADIYADFKFSDNGTEILSCPAGHKPKSNVYDSHTQKCKASFPIGQCKGCPHFSECNPTLHVRVATIKLAHRTSYHARQQRFFQTETFKEYARFRNGVETIPAALRKRHHVDKMPVRGLLRCRLYFGFKVAAMNVRKLVKYMSSLVKCTPNPAIV
jgi:hypothetical protein